MNTNYKIKSILLFVFCLIFYSNCSHLKNTEKISTEKFTSTQSEGSQKNFNEENKGKVKVNDKDTGVNTNLQQKKQNFEMIPLTTAPTSFIQIRSDIFSNANKNLNSLLKSFGLY